MRTSFLPIIVLIASLTAANVQGQSPSIVNITPLPVSYKTGNGLYSLPATSVILATSDEEKNVAMFLADFIRSKSLKADIAQNSKKPVITLRTIPSGNNQPEGYYQLTINKKGIIISAAGGQGLFYGVQSLIQLAESNTVPFIEITDYPRFQWRGLHLDVGRHFFSVDFIKRYIDLMSHYKFNKFHWHLTEDQGWRIEIKKYPKLQEIAAYRKETMEGHYSKQPRTFDGRRYGGFYTQEEIKDVVAYAAKRYITVVPEIEMPGHSLAALSAYPDLGCTGGPYEAATLWGVFDDVYCAGKESTFDFLQNVLDEVTALFPGEYIHIGGDECPKTRWKTCDLCQKRMKDENLKDEHELQSYFVQRVEKYLNSKGRKLIGWDEILEGGLAPNATVMSWRGEEGGIAAAKSSHTVVMSPGFALYFDHYQADPASEPVAIGGLTPLKKVYEYDPVPASLSEKEQQYILGAQANVWTEYMKTSDYVEYMVYPRALALSEVVWSPKSGRDWNSFLQRLPRNLLLLDSYKVNYRKPKPEELK